MIPMVFVYCSVSSAARLTCGVGWGSLPRFQLQDEKYARIACRRLGRLRGTVGFGNARAVRNLYEQVIKRQSARVIADRQAGGDPDMLLFTRDDVLGPKHIDVNTSQALRQLAGMQVCRSGAVKHIHQLSRLLNFCKSQWGLNYKLGHP
jgi:hypothetical protein